MSKSSECVPKFNDISLRDWFAGQALSGLIARLSPEMFANSVDCADWSCETGDAYRIADQMLATRCESRDADEG